MESHVLGAATNATKPRTSMIMKIQIKTASNPFGSDIKYPQISRSSIEMAFLIFPPDTLFIIVRVIKHTIPHKLTNPINVIVLNALSNSVINQTSPPTTTNACNIARRHPLVKVMR